MPRDFQKEIAALNAEMAALSSRKRELLDAYALTLTDLRVGDWVSYANSTDIYEIRRIYMKYDTHLTFVGAKIRKDGTPSTLESELWRTYRGELRKVTKPRRTRRVR